MNAEGRQERREVAAPRDGHGDIADSVFEDQVPADDPRHQLAERRVRVRIRAPRLRDHRRELGIAKRREAADESEQQERENQRGAGAVAHDLTGRQRLAGRGRSDRGEDAGANHRADREHHQVAGAHHALQGGALFGLVQQAGDRLALEEL